MRATAGYPIGPRIREALEVVERLGSATTPQIRAAMSGSHLDMGAALHSEVDNTLATLRTHMRPTPKVGG